jgi:hypothetical protein
MMQDKRSFNQNCRAIEGDHSHVTDQSFVPKIKFTSAYIHDRLANKLHVPGLRIEHRKQPEINQKAIVSLKIASDS